MIQVYQMCLFCQGHLVVLETLLDLVVLVDQEAQLTLVGLLLLVALGIPGYPVNLEDLMDP